MKLRTRLLLTWAAIAVLLVGSGLYAIDQLTRLQRIAEDLQGSDAEASVAVGRLQTNIAELDRSLRSYVAVPSSDMEERSRSSLAAAREQLDVLKRSGFESSVGPTESWLTALANANDRIVSLVETGRTEAATSYLESVKDTLTQAQLSLDAVAAAIDRRGVSRVDLAQRISET